MSGDVSQGGMGGEEIIDDTAGNRFELTHGRDVAELTYQQEGDRLVLIHTGVPPVFRGQGIAGRLVVAAVQRAARDGLTLVPLCPYARRWLEEHPDDAGDVRIDWGNRHGA